MDSAWQPSLRGRLVGEQPTYVDFIAVHDDGSRRQFHGLESYPLQGHRLSSVRFFAGIAGGFSVTPQDVH
jgi:hypothetical protein